MPGHRHFTMSALSATVAIRQYLANHPEVDALSAAVSVARLDADLSANDFDAGLQVHAILPADITFHTPALDLPICISTLVNHHRPWWIKGFPYGRERTADMMTEDERQCFRAARLFDEPPSKQTVEWWDRMAQAVRADTNDTLLLQGRDAERLSLDYERARLASLGISRAPKWIAVDDNGAGYDILSYDSGPVEPTNRLIEVKSSTQDPPRIILTRGEWNAAVKFGDVYVFHIWSLPDKVLVERRIADIMKHIPSDKGLGSWTHVEISID
jgi:hypothetical protein